MSKKQAKVSTSIIVQEPFKIKGLMIMRILLTLTLCLTRNKSGKWGKSREALVLHRWPVHEINSSSQSEIIWNFTEEIEEQKLKCLHIILTCL